MFDFGVVFLLPMDRRVFHIKSHLSQNLGRSWCVEEMADSVKLSPSRFKQVFKENTGISPMSYLFGLRLTKARELLSDTHGFLQIKEICAICGLMNESHFARDFKKLYGKTPTQFRAYCAEIEQSNL